MISYTIKESPGRYDVIVSNPITSEEKIVNLKVIPRIISNKNLVIYAYTNSIFKVLSAIVWLLSFCRQYCLKVKP